jgi:pimeloyl-ACP methyl ester carboxylesterase
LAKASDVEFSFVEANGVTLHCASSGPPDGPLVVLLHGFPEFWFAWRDYFQPLAERGFRGVAPDQRGYNLSSKPDGVDAYRLGHAAADAFAVASALGRERFHVVGHDWGAAVVWLMAGLEPRRLLSATMIQAPHPAIWLKAMRENPMQLHLHASRYVQFVRMPWLSEMSLKLGDFAGLAWAFRSSARPEAFSPDVLDLYREAWRRPGALAAMLKWHRALFVDDLAIPAPKGLKPPTLMIWGEKDAFTVPKLIEASLALCANARLRRLPQATHWSIHDQPEVVRDALLDHL